MTIHGAMRATGDGAPRIRRAADGARLKRDAPSRVIIVQPVVPNYRLGFFERLYQRFGARLTVHASAQGTNSLVGCDRHAAWQHELGPIATLVSGLYWQRGALSIPMKRGDTVFVCGAPRCLSNLALLVKARLKGATGIWWGHYWSSTSKGWRAAIRVGLMRLAHHLMFYTDKEIGEFLSQTDKPDGMELFALNNGIETQEIRRLRSPYAASQRADRLLFIGRLREGTGLELLLHALADPRCTHIGLDVIGGGEQEAVLHRLAEATGVAARVTWHGPCADEQVISKIANQSKLFAYPGAVGLSLIHMLSYGLPAIVHDDRWRHGPEFAALDPGSNGFLFKSGDANSLAQVLTGAIADDERLDRMSSRAVATTETDYNCQAMAERFFAAMTTLDERKSARVSS